MNQEPNEPQRESKDQPTTEGSDPETPQMQNNVKSPEKQEPPKQQSEEVVTVQKLMEDMELNDEANIQEKKQGEKKEELSQNFKSAQNQNQVLDETKYFVDISKTSISFGKSVLFPGSIQEVDVAIGLKEQILDDNGNNNPFMLRVIAKCTNQEFDSLDQYVFSVRSNERFQYFEEVRFKIRKKERALVKVAVKIPPVKENYTIDGILQIQLESLQPVCLPIIAKCEVPEIICIKDLFKVDEGCNMIKVPAKKNQIRMPPIPFKNLSNFSFTLEVEAITNENFGNRAYDIITQNFVNCQPNTQFFVNLQLKENINYKGVVPVKDTIRKVLVLKIKNSSVFFNFPLQVYVFESTNAGGMS